jgi:hypothetical protein
MQEDVAMKNGFTGLPKNVVILYSDGPVCPPGTVLDDNIPNSTFIRIDSVNLGVSNTSPTHQHTVDWANHTHSIPYHSFSGTTSGPFVVNGIREGINGTGSTHYHNYSTTGPSPDVTSGGYSGSSVTDFQVGNPPWADLLYCRVIG